MRVVERKPYIQEALACHFLTIEPPSLLEIKMDKMIAVLEKNEEKDFIKFMDNFKLITWSLRTTHLYLDDDFVLSNGVKTPQGTLCGRHPKARGRLGSWDDKKFDCLRLSYGSRHLRYGNMFFCKDCFKKLMAIYRIVG